MMEKVRSKQQQQQELEAAKRAAIEQLQNVYEQQNKILHAREVFHDSIVFNYFFEQSMYDSHRFISAMQGNVISAKFLFLSSINPLVVFAEKNKDSSFIFKYRKI